MKTHDEIKKGNPKCPWCGHEMRFDADSAHVWFKCDGCLASSPKTEKVWINVKHTSENWAINERNARTTCMILSAQVPKWISVKERLPEDCDEVLFVLYGRIYLGDYLRNEAFETPAGSVFFAGEAVTHWMPLPEPPKEDEDE